MPKILNRSEEAARAELVRKMYFNTLAEYNDLCKKSGLFADNLLSKLDSNRSGGMIGNREIISYEDLLRRAYNAFFHMLTLEFDYSYRPIDFDIRTSDPKILSKMCAAAMIYYGPFMSAVAKGNYDGSFSAERHTYINDTDSGMKMRILELCMTDRTDRRPLGAIGTMHFYFDGSDTIPIRIDFPEIMG